MDEINTSAVLGLISVAILGGIGIAAKETISNIWAGISFMLNPVLRRGRILEVKVQDQVVRGSLKSFSLSRAIIEDEEGNLQMVLISDLRKATIKVEGRK